VTRYRKLRGKSTESEAGKFLIPFLCVEIESCKRRDTPLFSHLEFTNVTCAHVSLARTSHVAPFRDKRTREYPLEKAENCNIW